jgi:hypothetical protein
VLRGLSDLKRLTIAATDGPLGSMGDLYFDERSWAVRYLVVDASPWLPGRRVFVPPVPVRSSDPTTIRVAFSKKQVELSSEVGPMRVGPVTSARRAGSSLRAWPAPEPGGETHLQTATAVLGYAVRPSEGRAEDIASQCR